jgi:hypothetical protein
MVIPCSLRNQLPNYRQVRKHDLKLKILEATDRLKVYGILKMETACSSEIFLPTSP